MSPRKRAQRTLELLDLGCQTPYPWQQEDGKTPLSPNSTRQTSALVSITPSIREWDYGDYEGITSSEIRAQRAAQGLSANWDIWRDGCPSGESPADIVERLDKLIAEIRRDWHEPVMGKGEGEGEVEEGRNHDVLIVAHGHILRALAMRWIGKDLESTAFLLEAGGVGTLR